MLLTTEYGTVTGVTARHVCPPLRVTQPVGMCMQMCGRGWMCGGVWLVHRMRDPRLTAMEGGALSISVWGGVRLRLFSSMHDVDISLRAATYVTPLFFLWPPFFSLLEKEPGPVILLRTCLPYRANLKTISGDNRCRFCQESGASHCRGRWFAFFGECIFFLVSSRNPHKWNQFHRNT